MYFQLLYMDVKVGQEESDREKIDSFEIVSEESSMDALDHYH